MMGKPICDRCGKPTTSTRMSMFNTDICCPACIDKERQHPDYQKARDAEHAQVVAGNLNFAGIGKPSDL